MIITIDGPAGAGKSSVAKLLALKLDFHYLDTGAMYRAVALEGLKQHVSWDTTGPILEIAKKTRFQLENGKLMMNGSVISEEIRSQEVTQQTHFVADTPEIRAIMVEHQRGIANGKNIVTEGRDQGTAVFPHAEHKFFLIATPEERARRRMEEYRLKGETVDMADILEQINLRDARDSGRAVGPLREPQDAVRIVTDQLGIEDVVDKIIGFVRP